MCRQGSLVRLDDPLAHHVGVEAVGQGHGSNRDAGLQARLDDRGPELGGMAPALASGWWMGDVGVHVSA